MKLWLCLLLVVMGVVGVSKGAVDLSSDPHEEALYQIFAPEMEKHTGVDRLRWHVAHLKGITRMLSIMNMVRSQYEERPYSWNMNTFEEEWKMYDIMLDINNFSWDTELTNDMFVGDAFVFPRKFAWHANREEFAAWLTYHVDNWGSDFFKYIVQDDDFGYNITDPTSFVDAVYSISDPTAFARSVGMTLQQFERLNESWRKAATVMREYWEAPMLTLEILKELCELGMVPGCDVSSAQNAM